LKPPENHNDIRRGGSYHSSIETFLNANIPLTFIIVTSYESAYKDDSLINEFWMNWKEREKFKIRQCHSGCFQMG
jgi:hypothetical protein